MILRIAYFAELRVLVESRTVPTEACLLCLTLFLQARQFLPNLARREDGDAFNRTEVEQLLVAGDEDIGPGSNGTSKARDVVGIFEFDGRPLFTAA